MGWGFEVVIHVVLNKKDAVLEGMRHATYRGAYAAGFNFEKAEKGIHCFTCPPNVPHSRGGGGGGWGVVGGR
jgi:hypothetical protein